MTRTERSTAPRNAAREPARPRDRWRTIRTITCELRALTGPARPPGFGRPLAAPEVLVQLPSFQGHMLRDPVLPLVRASAPTTVAPAAPSRTSLVGPLVLFAVTGFLLGWLVFLASS